MIDLAGSLEAARRQHAEGCVKTAEDLARYREVIARTAPDGVIEIGTFSGKSAVWFATETSAPVVTVDVNPQVDDATRSAGEGTVTWLVGRSDDTHVINAVHQWVRNQQVANPLVVLDGDHSAMTVATELLLYSPFVAVGGYCVVEDTLVRWMPWEMQPEGPYHGNPLDAVEGFLVRRPTWGNDQDLEDRYPTTQFPGGWLRRDS